MPKPSMLRAASAFVVLVALCVVVRVTGDWNLIPSPPNFKPLAGAALLAGLMFANWRWAVGVPLLAMIVSDSLIGGYEWRQMVVVYGSLLLPVALGRSLRARFGVFRLAAFTVASSFFFFAATNFAVWAFGTLYTHDAAGLARCYTMALPFFKYTLAGDALWTTALVGSYLVATRGLPRLAWIVEALRALIARPVPQPVRKK